MFIISYQDDMEIQGRQGDNEGHQHVNNEQADHLDVKISQEKSKFYYGVADKPPLHLTLFFGLQVYVVNCLVHTPMK